MADASERFLKKWWGMALTLSGVIFLTLLPQLIGYTEILLRTYELFQFPVLVFYKVAILQGESILWNPFIFSGFPVFVSVTGGFFSPIFYVALKFFSVPLAYHWLTFFNLLIASFVTTRVAHKLHIRPLGQFLAGIVYIFGAGHYVFFLPATNALVLLPILVFCLMEADERLRFWPIAVGTFGVFLGWTSSHWQWFFLVLTTVGFFAIYFSYNRAQQGVKNFFQPLLCFICMVAGGTFFGLIQIIPTLTFVPLSVQLASGYSHVADLYAGINPITLVTFFLPYFEHSFITAESIYIGILPIVFFLAAIRFSTLISRFLILLFWMLFLLATAYSPLFWLMHHIPPLNLLHGPQRWIYVGFFPFALLVGFGADALRDPKNAFRIKIFSRLIKWISILLVMVSTASGFLKYFFNDKLLFLLNTYFDEFLFSPSMQYAPDYYHRYIASTINSALQIFDPLNIQFALPMFFLVCTYILLRYYERTKFESKNFIAIATIVVVLNFVFVFWAFDGLWSRQKYLNTMPKTTDFIKDSYNGRYFTFLGTTAIFEKLTIPHSGEKDFRKNLFDFNGELLLLNINVPYKIHGAEYLEPMASRNMAELLAYLGSPAAGTVRGVATTTLLDAKISVAKKSQIFTHRRPIISLLGIRYIT
ncbi:MAG: hypothetical protein AAB795_03795, partial [Patescibacteria group bacterium]